METHQHHSVSDTPNNQFFKEEIAHASARFQHLKTEVKKVIVGQDQIIEFVLIGLLCDGHILLEGVPGVAKTTMIKTITDILGLSFKRIQFTPDLLPSDVIGTLIYNQKTAEFETKKGPIFAHLVLADEINRAPAKVQAALLEAMQERQVTIGNQTFSLERPFLVLATQNPIEHEGTYRLPEAQVDRFMFKLLVHYPTPDQEKEVIKLSFTHPILSKILTREELLHSQNLVKQVYCDELITDYMVKIVDATRNPEKYALAALKNYIMHGASPRATLALHHTARAYAFLRKRHFVIPDDVKAVATAVLRHRIMTSFEADAENVSSDILIKKILDAVPTP
jgi:MoxR-like ATPase